jgi:hypothetical protein
MDIIARMYDFRYLNVNRLLKILFRLKNFLFSQNEKKTPI